MISVDEYFQQEKECDYKGEHYTVRNNGAIMRHSRTGKAKRKSDEIWTFGNKDNVTGYMKLGTARVHQIVVRAFYGNPPNEQYVVDHIDTNKCNNRPENLRWVTRLENALNNPITRRRIILCCGSIENFLANPALLREGSVTKNFEWMRTVSPDEAKISKDKLERWAKEDSVPTGNGKLGEWIYKNDKGYSLPENTEVELVTQSQTKNAVQIDWRTPTLFPQCPENPSDNPLQEYLNNLADDALFATNQYGDSKVLKADFNKDKNAIFVATYTESETAVKGYALAQIEYDATNKIYRHKSCGTFFEEKGAIKYFTKERGYEWVGDEDLLDDLVG